MRVRLHASIATCLFDREVDVMNIFSLAAGADAAELTLAERATTALIVSLQGMLTIFLVLSVLWGAIEVLHLALGREKKAKPEKTVAQAPVAEDTPATVIASEPAALAIDDGAIVAAITAAISAQLASEGYTGGFRVVSFKRSTASSKRRA